MLDIKEYLEQTNTVLLTRDAFDELMQRAFAQQKHTGRWIHDGYAFKGGIDWMHCSECGHKDSWSVATRTPFCGWCGARMEDNEE